ncbi:MAG: DUF559 domain-containing protein [Solirubrobacteraceae bacterium]|nr:DUF559 domain-containing protein [Solirubrobacteraceae bacterium]
MRAMTWRGDAVSPQIRCDASGSCNRSMPMINSMESVADLAQIVALADSSDRCITVHQLRGLGYTAKKIRVLTRRGFLQRVFRGVYVVATAELNDAQVIRCALLAAGASAHVAARTALEVRKAAAPHRGGQFWIGVVGGQRRPRRATGVRLGRTGRPAIVHFIRVAAPVETEMIGGVSVACVGHALVDTAVRESKSMLRRIVHEADYLQLLDEDELNRTFDRKRRGTGALRRAIPAGPLTAALTGGPDSRAAHRLVRALVARGFVPTSVDQPLRVEGGEFRPDILFLHELRRLAVEVDGPQHRKPHRRALDKARDAILARARIDTLRIETDRIRTDLEGAVDDDVTALHRQALAP